MKLERIKRKVICKQVPTANSITCGTENPSSLKCEYYELEGGEVATFFVPQRLHEGHFNIMHGGLSGSVLDELMGRATLSYCKDENVGDWAPRYVTAEMIVKYKKPIHVGEKIYGYGKVDKKEGRCCFASADLINEEQEIVATATGVFVEVKSPKSDFPKYKMSDKNREELTKNDPKVL